MELEDNKRRRRISEAEEATLLAVASPHLRSMIIAALETGMRRGEMLALRFGDIDWALADDHPQGPRTKFQESFTIPPNRASLEAKTPPRNPLQVTDRLRDGELACQPKPEGRRLPLRGFAKGCNVKFAGIAA